MIPSWLKQTPAAYYYDFSLRHCSAIVLEVKLRWAQLQGPVATGTVPGARVEGKEPLAHGHDHDHLPGFVLTAQTGVEVADDGGGHVMVTVAI